jgi:hypothetical protein
MIVRGFGRHGMPIPLTIMGVVELPLDDAGAS